MAIRKRILAIFTYSKVVMQFIGDANAFITALTTAPGNTFVTIPPATITTVQGHIATLTADEATAAGGGEGTADIRDQSLEVVITDIRGLQATVQLAADGAASEAEAVTLVHSCGLKTRKVSARVKPDFAVKNDREFSGLLHLVSKAANRGTVASYEWQSSPNGINFTQIKITTQSRTTWLTGLAPGTKVFLRKRVITNKDVAPATWSQTVVIIVT